jgi:hypothetical protein
MSIKIRLKYAMKFDLEFLSAGIKLRLIRLISIAQLLTKDGWTRRYDVIIDTGNPVSIIPQFIWEHAEIKWLYTKDVHLYGIGSGNITGKLGEVQFVFSDDEHVSEPIKAKAFLANDNSIPFLIGFEDVLTTFSLQSNFATDSAFLAQN